jgi:hypothetical protein
VTKLLYVEHSDDNLYMLKTRLELLGDFEELGSREVTRLQRGGAYPKAHVA